MRCAFTRISTPVKGVDGRRNQIGRSAFAPYRRQSRARAIAGHLIAQLVSSAASSPSANMTLAPASSKWRAMAEADARRRRSR